MQFTESIFAVQKKLHAGVSLSDADLRIAEVCLDSSGVHEKILACEVLLRTKRSIAHVERAKAAMEQMCVQMLSEKSAYLKLLISVLFECELSFIQRSSMRGLTLAAASDSETGCRLNAALVLGRLAADGDSEALRSLQTLAKDTDELVAANVQYSLKKLRGE